MKILYKNIKKGIIKVRAECSDDLWVLSEVISRGDTVSGRTFRKIKLGGEDSKSESYRKEVYLSIIVETIEFYEYGNELRISGKIINAQEDIPAGAYHTISVREGSEIEIEKKDWLNFQLEKLEQAQNRAPNLLICLCDRDSAEFYRPRFQGYEKLLQLRGEVEKKMMKSECKDFYAEIKKAVLEYNKRLNPDKIIVASPSFWKESLSKALDCEELKGKLLYSSISSADSTSLSELMKRPEVLEVLKHDRIANEDRLVSELLEKVAKGRLAEYGIEQVRLATSLGAVDKLLVADSLISEAVRSRTYSEFEELFKNVEKMGGKVFILSSKDAPGQRLLGLSGIAATLRFPIS
ncbi:MAG: mRNA surveillance protein pelota [Candidatus Woesearchaeota archaeon]